MSRIDSFLECDEFRPRVSHHTQQRLRQRGLREADLDRLRQYGEVFNDGYLMSKRAIGEHITQLKSEIQRLEHLKGVVLIEQDNTLVTVYRTNRRRQRRILGGRIRPYRKDGKRNAR